MPKLVLPEATAPRGPANRAVLWLLVAAALPLLLFEAVVQGSWGWFDSHARGGGPPVHALLFEAQTHQLEGVDTLVVGNSIARRDLSLKLLAQTSEAIEHIELLHMAQLSPVELAMTFENLLAPSVERILYPVSLWGVAHEPQWTRLRFFEPQVAVDLAGPGLLWREHTWWVAAIFESRLALLRQRRGLLEITAGLTGLPLAELLTVDTETPWLGEDLEMPALPNLQTRALAAMGRMARERGVTLVVISPPIQAREAEDEADAAQLALQARIQVQIDALLSELAEAEGFVYLPAPPPTDYDANLFRDRIHLNDQGRKLFSRRLGVTLDNLLETP